MNGEVAFVGLSTHPADTSPSLSESALEDAGEAAWEGGGVLRVRGERFSHSHTATRGSTTVTTKATTNYHKRPPGGSTRLVYKQETGSKQEVI